MMLAFLHVELTNVDDNWHISEHLAAQSVADWSLFYLLMACPIGQYCFAGSRLSSSVTLSAGRLPGALKCDEGMLLQRAGERVGGRLCMVGQLWYVR